MSEPLEVKQGKTRRCFKYFGAMLLHTSMPVWLTLLLTLAGTIAGTAWIVPQINRDLELQKIKASYIVQNIRSLNENSITIVTRTAYLTRAVETGAIVPEDAREDVVRAIGELQWRLIELDVILTDTADRQQLKEFGNSLAGLRIAVDDVQSREQLDAVYDAATKFAETGNGVLKQMYSQMGLAFDGDAAIGP